MNQQKTDRRFISSPLVQNILNFVFNGENAPTTQEIAEVCGRSYTDVLAYLDALVTVGLLAKSRYPLRDEQGLGKVRWMISPHLNDVDYHRLEQMCA